MPGLRLCDICSGGLKSALVSIQPSVRKRRRGSGALVGGTYLAWLLVRKQAKLREQWLGQRGPILFLPRRQGLEPQGGGVGCESGHGCPHPGAGVPCSTPPSITKGLIRHWRQQTPLGMTGATWRIPWAGLQPSCLMPSLPPSSCPPVSCWDRTGVSGPKGRAPPRAPRAWRLAPAPLQSPFLLH